MLARLQDGDRNANGTYHACNSLQLRYRNPSKSLASVFDGPSRQASNNPQIRIRM